MKFISNVCLKVGAVILLSSVSVNLIASTAYEVAASAAAATEKMENNPKVEQTYQSTTGPSLADWDAIKADEEGNPPTRKDIEALAAKTGARLVEQDMGNGRTRLSIESTGVMENRLGGFAATKLAGQIKDGEKSDASEAKKKKGEEAKQKLARIESDEDVSFTSSFFLDENGNVVAKQIDKTIGGKKVSDAEVLDQDAFGKSFPELELKTDEKENKRFGNNDAFWKQFWADFAKSQAQGGGGCEDTASPSGAACPN